MMIIKTYLYKSLLIVGTLCSVYLIICFAFESEVYSEVSQGKIENYIDKMTYEIDRGKMENPLLSAGSNPYDYIVDNEYYYEVIAAGLSAIPVLENYIVNNGNGLNEYIAAIAIEEIAAVNLKGISIADGMTWANANEFSENWNYLAEIVPGIVEQTLSGDTSDTEKQNVLEELGALALPYIIESNEHKISELEKNLFDAFISKTNNKHIRKQLEDFKEYLAQKGTSDYSPQWVMEKHFSIVTDNSV